MTTPQQVATDWNRAVRLVIATLDSDEGMSTAAIQDILNDPAREGPSSAIGALTALATITVGSLRRSYGGDDDIRAAARRLLLELTSEIE